MPWAKLYRHSFFDDVIMIIDTLHLTVWISNYSLYEPSEVQTTIIKRR
jgi:hypothetical protein